MLTFNVLNNGSIFCDTLRPPSPLPAPSNTSDDKNYCPFAAGPFAFSTSIPLPSNYELATFDTRLYALDPWQHMLFCMNLNTTILDPGPVGSVYGHAHIIFWVTVGLAIAYWLVVGIARLASAWGRGSTRVGTGTWARVESAGFVLASAISGERLAGSPALMRFCERWPSVIVARRRLTRKHRYAIVKGHNLPHSMVCGVGNGGSTMADLHLYVTAPQTLSLYLKSLPDPILVQTAWSTLSYSMSK